VTIYVYGDATEAAKYRSTVEHYLNEMTRIFGKTSRSQSYWRQLSDTAKVHLRLINGQPFAYLYVEVTGLSVVVTYRGNSGTQWLYTKISEHKTKTSFLYGDYFWTDANDNVLSYLQDRNTTAKNIGNRRNNLYVYDSGKVLASSAMEFDVEVLAICKDTSVLNLGLIRLLRQGSVYSIVVNGVPKSITMPTLDAAFGTDSQWFFSGFSKDSKRIAIASTVVDDSTKQALIILTFNEDYSDYAQAIVYNKAISIINVTTTITTESIPIEGGYVGSTTTLIEHSESVKEPVILNMRVEGDNFCALRQQINSYVKKDTDVISNISMTESEDNNESVIYELNVIAFKETEEGTEYSIETQLLLPEVESSLTRIRSEYHVTDTQNSLIRTRTIDVPYYSALNKIILYRDYILRENNISNGGPDLPGIKYWNEIPGEYITVYFQADSDYGIYETDSCQYVKEGNATVVSSNTNNTMSVADDISGEVNAELTISSFVPPLTGGQLYRIAAIGESNANVTLTTYAPVINMKGVFNPVFYNKHYAYTDKISLFGYTVFDPVGVNFDSVFRPLIQHTLLFDIEKATHTLLNERLDFRGMYITYDYDTLYSRYSPISITN
jgi:hypothetical protein